MTFENVEMLFKTSIKGLRGLTDVLYFAFAAGNKINTVRGAACDTVTCMFN